MNCRPCVYGPLTVIRAFGRPGGRSPFSGDSPDGVWSATFEIGVYDSRVLPCLIKIRLNPFKRMLKQRRLHGFGFIRRYRTDGKSRGEISRRIHRVRDTER